MRGRHFHWFTLQFAARILQFCKGGVDSVFITCVELWRSFRYNGSQRTSIWIRYCQQNGFFNFEKDAFMANILVVEDEKNMQNIICEYMRRGGHTCFSADDGVDALMLLKNNPVDLMILDIMMPHLDGFSVCKTAREMSSLPIIMLTAKSDEEDKLKGYEYGADDYMTKPFSPKILLAKANALLRRTSADFADTGSDTPGSGSGGTLRNTISAGKIRVNPAAHKVFLDGAEITLTHKEYELLYFFMSNPGQVFSREQLLSRIWGYDFEGSTRTVDTHIKTLRQKLGSEGKSIVTLIRSGYKFEVAK